MTRGLTRGNDSFFRESDLMTSLRRSMLAAICAAVMQFTVFGVDSASAQIPMGQTVVTPGWTPLPSPGYVVYSPSYLAWRSAGYYGGNWGPYYYDPAQLYPYISGTTIWPITVQPYPPIGTYYRR